MKLINLIFQKKMFLVVVVIFTVLNYISQFDGINKTVGWNWIDLLIFYSPIIYMYLFFLFIIVYSILALIKRLTNFLYSTIHTILIIASAVLFEKYYIQTLLLFNLLSVLIFVLNVYWSLTQSNIQKLRTSA